MNTVKNSEFEDFDSDDIVDDVDEDFEEEVEDSPEEFNPDSTKVQGTQNKSVGQTVAKTKYSKEYDDAFSGDEKVAHLLDLNEDSYTRTFRTIKTRQIGFTEPIKIGRNKTMSGLTASVRDLGVLNPIHVMTVSEDSEDDTFKYIMLSGTRRLYAALRNGIEDIDAIVWDFKDKEKGADIALFVSLMLNRSQKRDWVEVWDLYQILELQSEITPGTLEYLLQMKPGEAMKLKDVMLCDYSDVKDALLSGKKELDGAYKMLMKYRKEEDVISKEDAQGSTAMVEGAENIAAEGDEVTTKPQLADEDVRELLDMASDADVSDVTLGEDDFEELTEGEDKQQKVGNRTTLDPALKSAVLKRDNFRCTICGEGGPAELPILAVHHILPVHTGGKDSMDNLTTLCLNHHILLHTIERSGGKIVGLTKEEFDSYTPENQLNLKKTRKLALVAVEADKRKHMTLDEVKKATTDSVKHPMPGVGVSDIKNAYAAAKKNGEIDSSGNIVDTSEEED